MRLFSKSFLTEFQKSLSYNGVSNNFQIFYKEKLKMVMMMMTMMMMIMMMMMVAMMMVMMAVALGGWHSPRSHAALRGSRGGALVSACTDASTLLPMVCP